MSCSSAVYRARIHRRRIGSKKRNGKSSSGIGVRIVALPLQCEQITAGRLAHSSRPPGVCFVPGNRRVHERGSIVSVMRSAFAFCVAACLGLCAAGAWAAGPVPGLNVTVTNTPTNPVPVTGSIGLTGNANVTVTNTGSNPLAVLTLNLDDSVRNAFQTRLVFGAGNPQTDKQFTVPTGKRLVIQSISMDVKINYPEIPEVLLELSMGGGTVVEFLPLTFAGVSRLAGGGFPEQEDYKALHTTRFLADGGTTVAVTTRPLLLGPANSTSTVINFSGYLVDMP